MALTPAGARAIRGEGEDPFRATAEGLRRDPQRVGRPGHAADLERCAELGVTTLRSFGARGEIHRIPDGPPVVLGSFGSKKGRPTVTVYNHLDVVPPRRRTEPWRTEPFSCARAGTRTSAAAPPDDKGPALSALYGARAAIDAGVPVNIKLLWELEEEVGSPTSPTRCARSALPAATDAVVVSDTMWVSRGRPAQSAGLRGLQPIRSTSRPPQPTSTRAPPAAWRATPWPSSPSSPRSCSTPVPAASRCPASTMTS